MEINNQTTTNTERKYNGVTLFFGKYKIHLDPFELLLFGLVLLPTGICIQDAWNGKLTFKESITRISMIAFYSAVVRLSPTEQISFWLSNHYIGKK
ncbi:hypothetical protein VF06_14995 [Nostoc linckia z4]|nr:hypothetical protein [Nostoc linckia]PHJ83048.1 hypothetical protein VF06_14995 [Nostoc linckia z4]PHK23132.1 hypothetical protein VF11_02115 [Nostoc linckia z14]